MALINLHCKYTANMYIEKQVLPNAPYLVHRVHHSPSSSSEIRKGVGRSLSH